MEKRTLIHRAIIVNEGRMRQGSVLVGNGKIEEIFENLDEQQRLQLHADTTIDAQGCYLLPGVIDEHVHFRDPGLTQKADICSESRAAAAGGVTSIMDMPNTQPQTTTLQALNEKRELMSRKSLVNYSCYFGATNDNTMLLKDLNKKEVCGVKLFMGSSTGNMLVDNKLSLERLFDSTDLLIASHCEDQRIINENTARFIAKYGKKEDVPLMCHPLIRSEEACYRSSAMAVELADKLGARLHILHISTGRELQLFEDAPLEQKKITAETCVAYLHFTAADYSRLHARIKCNPAIKDGQRDALRMAVASGRIDAIATDHAPHLLADKEGGALVAASGMPTLQFSLQTMLELADEGIIPLTTVVERMCHAPAVMYQIANRGFIRKGYQADLVLVRPESKQTIEKEQIQSKCGWSPFEGHTFNWKVETTFVNGYAVYNNGTIDDSRRGEALSFNR